LHLDGRTDEETTRIKVTRIFCKHQKAKHQHRKEDRECSTEFINCRRIDKQVCLFGLATWSN
jgi:hypothetical protein